MPEHAPKTTNGHRPAAVVAVRPARAPGDRPSEAAVRQAEGAVRVLLRALGEDSDREGLRDTPRRVVGALLEMTEGYREDPQDLLGRVFHEEYGEMVLVRDIPFTSLCEHHLLPVEGHASVAYLPAGQVVGLSKLSRVVQVFARRLQSQERMTTEIANAIEKHLAPRGVVVLVHGEHSCMAMRGVRTPATMTTSAFRGAFREPTQRAEFLAMAARAR